MTIPRGTQTRRRRRQTSILKALNDFHRKVKIRGHDLTYLVKRLSKNDLDVFYEESEQE